jgi:formamidopyrimidine-DNA glycosylase
VPELPEVETYRVLAEGAALGRVIGAVDAHDVAASCSSSTPATTDRCSVCGSG